MTTTMTPADLALAEYVAKKETPMLHVYANDCEWVVATSLEDAWAVYVESIGGTVEQAKADACDPLEMVPDDKAIAIWADVDGKPCEIGDGTLTKSTALEWATRCGRCYLASTES